MTLGWRGVVLAVVTLAVLTAGVSSCGGERSNGGAGGAKPKVAVSIFPLYDVARRVAGDRLDVVLVLPAGRSEHGYEPSPREMSRLADTRLAICVGLEMDGWLERIVRSAAGDDVRIVRVGPEVEPRRMAAQEVGVEAEAEAGHGDGHGHGHEHEGEEHGGEHEGHAHGEGSVDPHFWLDPVRMQRAVDVMVRVFGELDAGGAAGYRQRGDALKREIGALHEEIERRLRPLTKRTIVTFHASFGYFAERYDLQIAAVVEPFPGREPTARYVQDVVAVIRRSGAAALFSEPQLDPRPARVISEQAGVPLAELDPIGGSTGRDSYERLLRHDTAVLERALR